MRSQEPQALLYLQRNVVDGSVHAHRSVRVAMRVGHLVHALCGGSFALEEAAKLVWIYSGTGLWIIKPCYHSGAAHVLQQKAVNRLYRCK